MLVHNVITVDSHDLDEVQCINIINEVFSTQLDRLVNENNSNGLRGSKRNRLKLTGLFSVH